MSLGMGSLLAREEGGRGGGRRMERYLQQGVPRLRLPPVNPQGGLHPRRTSSPQRSVHTSLESHSQNSGKEINTTWTNKMKTES